MLDKHIITQLEELVNSVDVSAFPYQKGNSIRIAHIIIRKSRFGYSIFDCKINKRIAETYCKTAAVAYAKCLIDNRKYFNDIIRLDNKLAKHHVDSLFYKNTIEKTEDTIKREAVMHRLDIALQEIRELKARLFNYIMP